MLLSKKTLRREDGRNLLFFRYRKVFRGSVNYQIWGGVNLQIWREIGWMPPISDRQSSIMRCVGNINVRITVAEGLRVDAMDHFRSEVASAEDVWNMTEGKSDVRLTAYGSREWVSRHKCISFQVWEYINKEKLKQLVSRYWSISLIPRRSRYQMLGSNNANRPCWGRWCW